MGFKIWYQVGVWVTLFSKLPYSREFSNIWFQKSTDISYKRRLSTNFWKFQKAISIRVFVCGFNFRLCTYKFPPGSRNSASKPEAEGWVWWDGWDGLDGSEKCPLNFIEPYGHLELVYIYTCIQNKNCHQHSYGFQNLMSSWGLGNTFFEIIIFTWVFKYSVPKVNGYHAQKKFENDFLKIPKTCQYLSFGGGF